MTRNANDTRKEKNREPNAPAYIAYAVTDKGNGKSIWTRIATVYAHEDGNGFSFSQLNVVPTESARIVLRTPSEATEEKGA
jgi:hypothetical protein